MVIEKHNTLQGERRKQWLITTGILAANLVMWLIPSNVAYLIAQQRDVLLGRYAMGHFSAIIMAMPISMGLIYLTWASEKDKKQRVFKIVTLLL